MSNEKLEELTAGSPDCGTLSLKAHLRGIAFPLMLALAFATASDAAVYGSIRVKVPNFYADILLYAILFCLLFEMLFQYLHGSQLNMRYAFKSGHYRGQIFTICTFSHKDDYKSILGDACRILCCWMPYIILLFPGSLYWDTGDQLGQYFGISAWNMAPGVIWDHHPFFDTLLFGWFADFGNMFVGSYEIGLFLYVLVQTALLAVVLACILAYVSGRNIKSKVVRLMTFFICFFPVFPIQTMTISKDITHAIILLLWILLFLKLVDSSLTLLKSPFFLANFAVVTLIASLTKKMGLYIIVASLLVLLFGRYKIQLKAGVFALAAIVFTMVNVALPKYVYPVLNVLPGESQAAIVMPIEMLGRVAHYYPKDITPAERTIVDQYLLYSWDQISQNYKPYIADPVTGYGLKDGQLVKPKTSTLQFAKVWLKLGIRHPFAYLNGFVCLEAGWISFIGPQDTKQPKPPYKYIPMVMNPITHTMVNPDTLGKVIPNKPATWHSMLVDGVYKELSRIPVANVFCYIAVWTSVLPIFILYSLWRRRKILLDGVRLMQFVPYFVSVFSLFVYPVSLSIPGRQDPTRYMFHTLLLAPLVIGLLIPQSTETTRENQ